MFRKLTYTARLRVLAALPVFALAMVSASLADYLATLADTICGPTALEAAYLDAKEGSLCSSEGVATPTITTD